MEVIKNFEAVSSSLYFERVVRVERFADL